MTPQWHIMQAHPLAWAELFNPDSSLSTCPTCPSSVLLGDSTQKEFNVTSLAKMFIFGSFVKARAKAESITVEDIVKREVDQYPYTKRNTFHEPYFIPLDMFNNGLEFTAAITDSGACQVYSLEVNLKTEKTNLWDNVTYWQFTFQ